jgi:hypothetical protein
MSVHLKKREIISSIYPEKLVFDGFNYRTPRLNEAVWLVYNMDAAFEENKNGTNDNFFHLSHQVNPLVQNPNFLSEDLKLLRLIPVPAWQLLQEMFPAC